MVQGKLSVPGCPSYLGIRKQRLLFFSSFFLSLGDGPIFKKTILLNLYFNHKNIALVRFRVKSANYYGSYGTFSTSLKKLHGLDLFLICRYM